MDDDRGSANRIIPELWNLALVTHIDNENGVSWIWFLDPIDTNTTRLTTRFRQSWQPGLMNALMFGIADELGSLVMCPKTLSGIKQRAEGCIRAIKNE
ncbi:MAG: hypothetical protein GY832_17770 [Chloroflexi bacterium]|nr:hypothetical protein [Chloroflexota bacterium]